MKHLAVILPAYNRGVLLCEAVDSILKQDCSDSFSFQVVVVDDGSTDGTVESLSQKYQASIPDKLTILRQTNLERGAARNTGARWALKHSNTDWLLFFDSDDLMVPGALRSFCEFTQGSDSTAYGLIAPWNGETFPNFKQVKKPQGDLSELILSRTILPLGATFISASVFQKSGGFSEDRAMSGSEDWDFLTRVIFAGPVRYFPHLITYYRQHPGNTDTSRYLTSLDLAVNALTPHLKQHFPKQPEAAVRKMQTQATLLKIGAMIRMKDSKAAFRTLWNLWKAGRLWFDFRPYRLALSLLKGATRMRS